MKLLIVADSLAFRETFANEIIRYLPRGSVVEQAADLLTARDKLEKFDPDLMILDAGKSHLNTLRFIRRTIESHPLPIIFTSENTRHRSDALIAGAVDFFVRPADIKSIGVKFASDVSLRLKVAARRKFSIKLESDDKKPADGAKSSIFSHTAEQTAADGARPAIFGRTAEPTTADAARLSIFSRTAEPAANDAEKPSIFSRTTEHTSNLQQPFAAKSSASSPFKPIVPILSRNDNNDKSPIPFFNRAFANNNDASSASAPAGRTAELPKPAPVGDRLRAAADVASMYISKFNSTPEETKIATSGVKVGQGSVFVRRPLADEKPSLFANRPATEAQGPKIAASGVKVGQGSVFVRRTAVEDKLLTQPQEPKVPTSGVSVGQGSVFAQRPSGKEVPTPVSQEPKVPESGVSVGQGSVFVRRAPEITPIGTAISVKPQYFPPHDKNKKRTLIAMGASTGGTVALTNVLTKLKPPLPPIVIVQHIPPHFSRLFAERLEEECALTIHEAKDGMQIEANHVYIAPGGKHMRLKGAGNSFTLECAPGPAVNCVCPSVDVLFDTVADLVGDTAIGVILTGIGRDGADGLLKMRSTGAATIGQDARSSAIYGMPKAAWEIGAVEQQLPIDDIAAAVMNVAWNKE